MTDDARRRDIIRRNVALVLSGECSVEQQIGILRETFPHCQFTRYGIADAIREHYRAPPVNRPTAPTPTDRPPPPTTATVPLPAEFPARCPACDREFQSKNAFVSHYSKKHRNGTTRLA